MRTKRCKLTPGVPPMLLDMSPPPTKVFPSRAENISQGERSNTGKLLSVGAWKFNSTPSAENLLFFEKSTSLKKEIRMYGWVYGCCKHSLKSFGSNFATTFS